MATCTNILKVMTYGEKSKVTGDVLNDDEFAVQIHNTFTMVNLLIVLLEYLIVLLDYNYCHNIGNSWLSTKEN